MAACHIRYAEHSNSAKDDLTEAKRVVKLMCEEYGMASSFLSAKNEQELILQELYDEATALLNSLEGVVKSVEAILLERESITKSEVSKFLDEVL